MMCSEVSTEPPQRENPKGVRHGGPPSYCHTLFHKQGPWEFISLLLFFFTIYIHIAILLLSRNHFITKTMIPPGPLPCHQK